MSEKFGMETYKGHFTITASDRPEASYGRVVGEHQVEVIITTRLVEDPNRSLAEIEKLVKAAAIAALQ